MKTIFRPVLVMFFALTLICTVFYPYTITVIGQLIFADQVAGSLLMRHGQAVGSSLIGQAFSSPNYFWGRPSATNPMPNNATASNGSNLGPTNPLKINVLRERVHALKAVDPANMARVPIDLVTASASGLDPEISLAAAYYQAPRVARERQMTIGQVHEIIAMHSKARYFGFLGEPRVNVLILNLALDQPLRPIYVTR